MNHNALYPTDTMGLFARHSGGLKTKADSLIAQLHRISLTWTMLYT